MNFQRILATAFARKIAALIVALVVGLVSMLFVGEARAQSHPIPVQCATPAAQCTQEEAWQECAAWPQADLDIAHPADWVIKEHCNEPNPTPGPGGTLRARTGSSTASDGHTQTFVYVSDCPADKPFNPITKRCQRDCESALPLSDLAVRGTRSVCSDGCTYVPAPAPTIRDGAGLCMETADVLKPAFCGAGAWMPNGATCETDTPTEGFNPEQDTCRSTGGGFSHCVKPDGEQCVTGAQGTTMCWPPGESGGKTNPQGTEGASKGEGTAPPPPPPGMENPTPTGNSSTTINNNTTTVGGFTGGGNTGNQPGTGTPGQGGGNGGGDDGDEEGPGGPGGGVGELYEGHGKTIGSVFGDFSTRVQNAPIATAGGAYLSVTLTGACPVFSVEATDWWDAMSIDFHCQGPLADALGYGAYLLMAVAAFFGFRIALL